MYLPLYHHNTTPLHALLHRYYVEYLRLNSLRHVVDHTTQRNLDLEEECSLLQQTSAVAEIENESLTKEIARLSGVLADTTQNTTSISERLNAEVADLRYQLDTLQATHALHTTQSSEHTHALQQSVAQGRAALMQEQHTVEQLQSELSITRLTSHRKDGEIEVSVVCFIVLYNSTLKNIFWVRCVIMFFICTR